MVIDMHLHPIFYKPICKDAEELEFRKNSFGVWKQGPMDWDEVFVEMDYGGIEKSALLPLDITTTEGGYIVTNEQVAKLQSIYPDRLIGFASADPHRPDAKEVLIHAFDDLGLQGLKLHPSKQKFYPTEDFMEPIYEICESRNKREPPGSRIRRQNMPIRWPLREYLFAIQSFAAVWPILPGLGFGKWLC